MVRFQRFYKLKLAMSSIRWHIKIKVHFLSLFLTNKRGKMPNLDPIENCDINTFQNISEIEQLQLAD